MADGVVSGLAGSQDVGVNGGQTANVPEVVGQFLAQVLDSSLVNALGLAVLQNVFVRQAGVFPVGVLDVVGRGDQIGQPVRGSPAPLEVAVLDEVSGELGVLEGPGDGVVVDLLQDCELLAVLQGSPAGLGVVVVDVAHVVPEGDVIGVEVIAVGPLHALSEVEGPDSVVFVVLVVLDDVGVVGAVGVTTDDGLQSGSGQIPGAATALDVDGAAIGTDLQSSAGSVDQRHENVVLDGQAVLNGLGDTHHIGDVGGLSVGNDGLSDDGFGGSGVLSLSLSGLSGRGGRSCGSAAGSHGKDHCQSQKHSQKLLHFFFLQF